MLKKILSILLLIAFSVLAMVFGSENNQSIELSMFDWQTPELPLYLWLIAVFILGLGLGYLGRVLRPKN